MLFMNLTLAISNESRAQNALCSIIKNTFLCQFNNSALKTTKQFREIKACFKKGKRCYIRRSGKKMMIVAMPVLPKFTHRLNTISNFKQDILQEW